jgi:hypothetical protein
MKTTTLVIALSALASWCVAQTRIVGGTGSTAGAYPYMTALIEKGATPANGQFCGAALVAPQWVLTAAHCMEGTPASAVEVWIGGRDLRNAAEGVRVAVSQVVMHPSYGENSQGALVYDFCLLKLARPVTERATLPLVEAASQVAAGITSRVIGWGATREGGSGSSVLLQVDLPLVSLSTAGQTNPGLGVSHLAAGRASGGIDSCQGDSGGPLMVRNAAGQWAHGGTVSYGNGCARPGEYGIYGNTLTVKPWILSYISTVTPTDDHGNTTATATTLAVNSSTVGNLERGGDLDVFRIQAPSSGSLVIQSTGLTDVVGTLLNASGTVLTSNDNGAGTPNFRITRTLTAGGTYFVRVSGKTTTTTGSYGVNVTLTGQPVTNGDIEVTSSGAAVAMNSTLAFGSATVSGTAVTKSITLANRGNGALAINGVSISPSGVFSLTTQPSSSIAIGAQSTFNVAFRPTATGAVSATLTITSNDPDESPYVVTLSGSGTAASTGDDFGNSFATAATITGTSQTAGVINTGTDIDMFRFTIASRRSVTIKTTGAVDTYGTLYNSSNSVITEADDTGSDLNFTITRTLSAGTYYIAVEGYSSSDVGAYTLIVR